MVTVSLTEDMYDAVRQELGDLRTRSPELEACLTSARAVEQGKAWPERTYVISCPDQVAEDLERLVRRAADRARGVRRGALARAGLRIAEAVQAARGRPSRER